MRRRSKGEATAKPFRTLELNLLFNRWAAICPFRNIIADLSGVPYMKDRTETDVSLPQFKCWLNCMCVR